MQSRNFCASLKQGLRATFMAALLFAATATVTTTGADAANRNYRLPATTVAHMAYAPASGSRNGLPATVMDSFVRNAIQAGRAEAIYGDEGTGDNPPPFYGGFTAEHRINAGIVGQQDAGLTTGHGSLLPDAWGRDEFLGLESSQSGSNSGSYDKVVSPDIQTVASYDLPPVAPSFRKQQTSLQGYGGALRVAGANGGNAAAQGDSGF